MMGVLFSLLLPLSITIDNVVIGQNSSLPPSRVAVISAVIHLALLMIGVSFAPNITPYLPASKHLISPTLFAILGMLSLWTACHQIRAHCDAQTVFAPVSFYGTVKSMKEAL